MKNTLMKSGRILFAIPFGVFGVLHFLNNQQMAESMLSGWPIPNFFVYISGAGLILASISIITNRFAGMASFLLAVELFIFIIAYHVPGIVQGDEAMLPIFMSNLLKDFALMGGALVLSGIYSEMEKEEIGIVSTIRKEDKEEKRTRPEKKKERKEEEELVLQ